MSEPSSHGGVNPPEAPLSLEEVRDLVLVWTREDRREFEVRVEALERLVDVLLGQAERGRAEAFRAIARDFDPEKFDLPPGPHNPEVDRLVLEKERAIRAAFCKRLLHWADALDEQARQIASMPTTTSRAQ